MSVPRPARRVAPRRYTSLALSAGVLVAGVLFAVALVLELTGRDVDRGDMADLAAVIDGLVTWSPWAWAALGTYTVVATPLVGLLVTALEYWSIEDRRTVSMALAVVAVLAISTVIAILR